LLSTNTARTPQPATSISSETFLASQQTTSASATSTSTAETQQKNLLLKSLLNASFAGSGNEAAVDQVPVF
jgi:hypothetical protein